MSPGATRRDCIERRRVSSITAGAEPRVPADRALAMLALRPLIAVVRRHHAQVMDVPQILTPALVGLAASVVTAVVTHLLTRAQEQRKHERDVAAKLAALKSTERAETMVMAVQYGHSCFIIERPDQAERDRIFLPMGSRITMGRDATNHLRLDHPSVSKMHAAFRAQGNSAYIEPLAPTNGVEVNAQPISHPRKLATGDVITVPGAPFKITFVPLVA